MNRNILFILLLLLVISCNKKDTDQPNILFITTDYQAWEDIPAVLSFVEMPALDKLSREGVVMENHYCIAPICMPSRYTIVSGRYPHFHNMWDNGSDWLPEGTPTLMEKLSDAGYYNVGIGKMHFKPWERMAGFDVRITAEGKKNGARDTLLRDDYAKFLEVNGLNRWDYLRLQKDTEVYGVYDWPFADSLHTDHFVGERSVRFISKDSLPEPWFMWISFSGPHNPWDPPARYTQKYLEKELPKARSFIGELDSKPQDHRRVRYNYTGRLPRYMENNPEKIDSIIHRIKAGHYGNLTFIDEQIGRIINSLEQRNGLRNTAIFFSSDHGAHLGDHENIHKGTHYERSAHVPMVIWYPELINPGVKSAFSTHVDIMPTFLGLAGVEPDINLPGYDLWPMLNGNADKVQDYAINEIRQSYSIITHDYKLGIYPNDSVADFYDRRKDPDELINCYSDPEYKVVIDSLMNVLLSSRPWLADEWPFE